MPGGILIELELCKHCGEWRAQWADLSGRATLCDPCYKDLEAAIEARSREDGFAALARFLAKHEAESTTT